MPNIAYFRAVDRYSLLPNDSDFFYNFTSESDPDGANRKTRPAHVGNGMSMVAAEFPGK